MPPIAAITNFCSWVHCFFHRTFFILSIWNLNALGYLIRKIRRSCKALCCYENSSMLFFLSIIDPKTEYSTMNLWSNTNRWEPGPRSWRRFKGKRWQNLETKSKPMWVETNMKRALIWSWFGFLQSLGFCRTAVLNLLDCTLNRLKRPSILLYFCKLLFTMNGN